MVEESRSTHLRAEVDPEEAVVVATEAAKVVREATEARTEADPTAVDLMAVVLDPTVPVLADTALVELEVPMTSRLAVTEVQATALKVDMVVVLEAMAAVTRVLTEATANKLAATVSRVQEATANRLEATVASKDTLLSPQLLEVLKVATVASSPTANSLRLASVALELVQARTVLRATARAAATADNPLATKRDGMLDWRRLYRFSR